MRTRPVYNAKATASCGSTSYAQRRSHHILWKLAEPRSRGSGGGVMVWMERKGADCLWILPK
ncbi:hypothetical protein P343_02235 [Sporolactobacillus laevolacticus DSM 442]|uniref:Uncharacterized protein n=1 Tax=Sporolactobacillus laevolacticus DSM 442 TaxID=1395513 RepID=V6JAB8_9BACL|nr:hypothetical protein P343_02235 [Sporolactobacillus laevolacticus DSM 442]